MKKKIINKPVMPIEEQTDNDMIEDAVNSIIREAITHFSHRPARFRSTESERFFFKQEEVDRVMAGLPHPEWVKTSKELNDDGSVFCWKICWRTCFAPQPKAVVVA